ncbi:JmjC domain-containing protein [Micromonospora sp. NPDC050417]|uniref:JmjC domain-containing protein n=1 Tax=Micromonospora sp. NPDC050417 TaxID=3364280 RepID=UPI00379DE3DE
MSDSVILRDLVGDVPAFLAEFWRRVPAVLRPVHPPVDVFTVQNLEQSLAGGLLRPPYIGLMESGEKPAGHAFTTSRTVAERTLSDCVDAEQVVQRVAEGASVLLRNIEHWHTPTAAFAYELGTALGRPVEAFFFLTPPERQALPPHRDDADVFVIQVQGCKEWTVHRTPADGRWDRGRAEQPGEIVLRTRVTPGDVLYLPRGAAHSAVAADGSLSAHLSLTVRDIGSAQLSAVVQQYLAADLDLPARPVEESALLDASARLLEHQRRRLAELTPQDLVGAARTGLLALRGKPPAAPRFAVNSGESI